MQKGLQEIYRGTFRALCPKLKNVQELQDPIHRGLLLGVEDTGYVTIEHPSQTYCFYCFPRPFVSYCFTSTVSCTPTRSPIEARHRHLSVKKIILNIQYLKLVRIYFA